MSTQGRKVKYHKRPGRYVSQEVRDAQAAAVNRTWLEPCEDSRTPKKIQCNGCGHVSKVTPHSVYRGYYCKPCSIKKMANNRRITQDEWDSMADAISMRWLAPVEDTKTQSPIACLKCKHEWTLRADSMFSKVKNADREMPWCPACEAEYRDRNALDIPSHGSNGYQRHGCRCTVCAKAKAAQTERAAIRKRSQV